VSIRGGAEPRREGSKVPKKFLLLAVLILSAALARAGEDIVLPDVNATDAFEGAKENVQGTWWNLLWTDELTHPVLSADGSSVACAMRKGSKWAVMKDGKVYGSEYDSIGRIVLSADGKSIAFQGQKGRRFHIVWNGRESTGYTSCTAPAFSPVDGELAFLAEVEGKKVLFRNGRSAYRKGYDFVSTPVYSSRGSIAFMANYKGREFMVRDGVRVGGVYRSITDPVFSQSGAVYFGATTENSIIMTREGSIIGYPIRYPPDINGKNVEVIKTSPASESVAYIVRLGEKFLLYRDGRLLSDDVAASYCMFAGNSLYYLLRNNEGIYIARDGVPVTRSYPLIIAGSLSVNAAGKIAFIVRHENGKLSVYVDDKQVGEEYDAVKSIVLTDDGSVFYFALIGKAWTAMKDGARIPDAGEYPYVTDFLRTGTRSMVFAATSGKEIVRKEINW